MFSCFGKTTSLEEGKLRIQTINTLLKNWFCVTSCPCSWVSKYLFSSEYKDQNGVNKKSECEISFCFKAS